MLGRFLIPQPYLNEGVSLTQPYSLLLAQRFSTVEHTVLNVLNISTIIFFATVQDFCRFKPCFPGVPCFNDPSTEKGFECGECPLGMLGDGINCTDVDEVTKTFAR